MKFIIMLGILFLALDAGAQMHGVVYGVQKQEKSALYGAKIKVLNAGGGVITNEQGEFELILPKELPDTLVFSAMGYAPDTMVVTKKDRFAIVEVILYSEQLLPEVVVSIKKNTTSISRLKTLHVEEISSGELRKAACCNLSESFETNASVDVNITDAVSGAKRIQMMGLDGVYTQLQFENIPFLNGLESSFGLNSMPGTWIKSIQITKGTGTVVNGYESMAGLINLELQKPEDMDVFYLNTYANRMGRSELNVHSGIALGKKWSTGVFGHASTHPIEMDWNKDGFRDMPNGTNLSFLNRYKYSGEHMEAQFGISAYSDERIGGQISAIRNSGDFYNVSLNAKNISAFAKTGFFMKKPGHSVGVVYHYKHQEQNSVFGLRNYSGTEDRAYVNAIYDGYIGTTIHKFKVGASMVVNNIEQRIDTLNDDRFQLVPGVFGEYTYTGARISAVLGIRGDHHNLYGYKVTPRAHLKFILDEFTDLRLTGGKGWRVPNYMIDNNSLLATSRVWVAPDTVIPEESWNLGGSLVREFKLFGQKSTLSMDYYYTYFENQLIVDRDQDLQKIVFKNIQGVSFSNSFQAEWSFTVLKRLDVRLAYKYLDVRSRFGNLLQQRVMVPKNRGFINLGYVTRNKRWQFDLTCSLYGKARLPVVQLDSTHTSTDNTSEVYALLNGQVSYKLKRIELYVGGENLTNYTQKNPIISSGTPFDNYFNATRIWAPVYGINVYAGLRYTIEKKNKQL